MQYKHEGEAANLSSYCPSQIQFKEVMYWDKEAALPDILPGALCP